MNRIKLFSVTWSTDTAGVSPHGNMRTEIFFKGCNKALVGDPCVGCFNQALWDDYAEKTYSPEEIANQIEKYAPNKYVTIGGGEPTDQMEGLIELTELLKQKGFHIMVYTWKDLQAMLLDHEEGPKFYRLLEHIDMLVDGIFDPSERMYKIDQGDGFLSSIGSGNQTIWDVKHYRENKPEMIGYKMRDLVGLYLKSNNDLVYITKDYQDPIRFRIRNVYHASNEKVI